MKVHNMESNRGNRVPNQFIITSEEGEYFQSYQTIIAFRPWDNEPIKLDRERWDYSRTTSTYRNKFLGETTRETEASIKDGTYILEDLNE